LRSCPFIVAQVSVGIVSVGITSFWRTTAYGIR
jgi:hypothetical protein